MKRSDEVRVSVLALALVFGLYFPTAAAAQTTNRAFVHDLFFRTAIPGLESPALVNSIAEESANAIANLAGVTLSTAPIASSSAGFTFVRDKVTGDQSFKSNSFGPTFADRPLTNGRSVFSFGFNFQYGKTDYEGGFDTADGRTIGLPVYDNTARWRDNGFEEFVTERAFLQAKSQIFNVVAAYGVTDKFDVGVVVPMVSLSLTGWREEAWNLTRKFADRGTAIGVPTAVGSRVNIPSSSQSASGIGDVITRLKYSWTGDRSDGAAVAADLRLPTGSEEDLLGAGKAALKLQALLLKSGLGPASIHGNAGYTVGGLSDEINYIAGVDVSTSRITVSGSFLGRTLLDGAVPTRLNTVNIQNDPTQTALVDRFTWPTEKLTLLQAAAGVKVHVGGQWLLNATVLVPLNQKGFQPGVAPVIGLEHTWDRSRGR